MFKRQYAEKSTLNYANAITGMRIHSDSVVSVTVQWAAVAADCRSTLVYQLMSLTNRHRRCHLRRR